MGGHGGLNILPQKSWNVYNRDNRRRVAEDEAAAAAAHATAAAEARAAVTSAGVERLRARAAGGAAGLQGIHNGGGSSEAPAAESEAGVSSHSHLGVAGRRFSLFEAEERAARHAGAAADAKRKEAAAVARLMPDLSLGRSAAERRPWYARPAPPSVAHPPPLGHPPPAALIPALSLNPDRLCLAGPTSGSPVSAAPSALTLLLPTKRDAESRERETVQQKRGGEGKKEEGGGGRRGKEREEKRRHKERGGKRRGYVEERVDGRGVEGRRSGRGREKDREGEEEGDKAGDEAARRRDRKRAWKDGISRHSWGGGSRGGRGEEGGLYGPGGVGGALSGNAVGGLARARTMADEGAVGRRMAALREARVRREEEERRRAQGL